MRKSVGIHNNAALKSVRRWIIAAYVWKLLHTLFCWLVAPALLSVRASALNILRIEEDYEYILIGGDIVFLILAVIAFFRLGMHTNRLIREASGFLIAAVIIETAMKQMDAGMIAGRWIYEPTGSPWLLFAAFFVIAALTFYPGILAFIRLGRCNAIGLYFLDIPVLSALVWVSSALTVCVYVLQYEWEYLRVYIWDIIFVYMFSIFYSVISVITIIYWKHLLRTPSAIPAIEKKSNAGYNDEILMKLIYFAALFLFTVLACGFAYILHNNHNANVSIS